MNQNKLQVQLQFMMEWLKTIAIVIKRSLVVRYVVLQCLRFCRNSRKVTTGAPKFDLLANHNRQEK